jgi:hypothetical protein
MGGKKQLKQPLKPLKQRGVNRCECAEGLG